MPQVKEKILIACVGDWNTSQIFDFSKKTGFKIKLISSFNGDFFCKSILRLASFFNKTFEGKKTFYMSKSNRLLFLLFDWYIALRLFFFKPNYFFAWSNMSLNSLKLAKRLDIKTFVYQGNASLRYDCKRLLVESLNSYILRQEKEQKIADKIIVESTFVKTTVLEPYRNKVIVIPTPAIVHKKKAIKKTEKDGNVDSISVAIIQANKRKNTDFALKALEFVADSYKVNVQIFGRCDICIFETKGITVNITGNLPREKYLKKLTDCDIALFPTLSDGGPRALLECLSLGLPVISSKYCIAPDLDIKNLQILELDEQLWASKIKETIVAKKLDFDTACFIDDLLKKQEAAFMRGLYD